MGFLIRWFINYCIINGVCAGVVIFTFRSGDSGTHGGDMLIYGTVATVIGSAVVTVVSSWFERKLPK